MGSRSLGPGEPAVGRGRAQGSSSAQSSYLPPPPASLETGPNGPAPGPNVFWSPGSWYWQENRYVWRPGFWAAVQPEWVWIPPHYAWTPGGCLFVEGYWDMPLGSRGLMFAPVYYPRPIYLQPAYSFTPSIVIAAPGLTASLFVQPVYSHYYFGDYYDRGFVSVGIVPWFSFTFVSGGGPPIYRDPLFSFYASVNVVRDPGWVTRVRQEYVARRENIALRPPRTYVEQMRRIERNANLAAGVRGRELVMARPLSQLPGVAGRAGGMRLESVSPEARRQWQERSLALRQYRNERSIQERRAESQHLAELGPGRAASHASARPRPLALPTSPVAAPIHHHAATGAAVGPVGHADQQLAASTFGEHRGPSYEHSGSQAPRVEQSAAQRAPLIEHRSSGAAAGLEHLDGPGRPAPHDVTAAGTEPAAGRPGANPSAGRLPLHAPAQSTHRQPPPAPRPAARRGRQE